MGRRPSVDSRLSENGCDFIDEKRLHGILDQKADPAAVGDVLAKSLAKEPLSLEEAAVLINTGDPERIAEMFETARRLKRDVYGNRIVLFAPLYIGNYCVNDCLYCHHPTGRLHRIGDGRDDYQSGGKAHGDSSYRPRAFHRYRGNRR